jgi:UDP-N-acetylglucosamine 2-epimerase (non-hydrolysing)
MKSLKIIVVAGARPNFMKVAPLMRAICEHNVTGPQINVQLLHTGQHYDETMSDVFFRELGIRPPDFSLGVGAGSHAFQTARIMTGIEPILERERPDWTVVVGDVNSTLACTLVCAKMGLRVAHIEAGLRSFDRSMPEEVNRLATDVLADLLLTPSKDASENLRREGVPERRIRMVGNIMIDSLVQNLEAARCSRILDTLDLRPRRFVYATLHRPANVDRREHLERIIRELGEFSRQYEVVFPVHPRTRKMLGQFKIDSTRWNRLKLTAPNGYHDSLCLTENARLVITDSGGLQEESTYFGTPCLTLRPNTERPVTITVGSNRLTAIDTLAADIRGVMTLPERFGNRPPLWDGKTAPRVVSAILEQEVRS